jgi:hypothetical protein
MNIEEQNWDIRIYNRKGQAIIVHTGTGPVELMETACKEAGVEFRSPNIGEMYFGFGHRWYKCTNKTDEPRPVIPAPEPEPEKPCPNCQNVKPGIQRVDCNYNAFESRICALCNRPESEWTYASDTERYEIGVGV